MAVKMRLRREGKRKQPFYRVVVADIRSPRDGRFIEDLGYYHPIREPSDISIDRARALYWLRNGVQPSQAVQNLLRLTGIWEEFRPGEQDPHAERRERRAARRQKTKGAQEAARRAELAAQREAEAAKAAADAEEADRIAEQAARENEQPAPEVSRDEQLDGTAEAAPEPAPEPTAEPGPEPTAETAPEPTAETAPEPTTEPGPEPTAEAAPEPAPEQPGGEADSGDKPEEEQTS